MPECLSKRLCVQVFLLQKMDVFEEKAVNLPKRVVLQPGRLFRSPRLISKSAFVFPSIGNMIHYNCDMLSLLKFRDFAKDFM